MIRTRFAPSPNGSLHLGHAYSAVVAHDLSAFYAFSPSAIAAGPSAISDNGVITGQFSREEAESLSVQMRYGALPVPLKVVDVRTIGASLGQDSVDASVTAGIIGMAMVLLFMLILFRVPGFLADVALSIYVTLNLAIYKLFPITLTLPGIAGFLLSVGMAVDANVLIFARMKEELRCLLYTSDAADE